MIARNFRVAIACVFIFTASTDCRADDNANGAIDFSGHIELQQRLFTQREYPEQQYAYTSVALNPQWRFDADKNDALTLRLFARHDFSDSSRTHGDVREALWQHIDGAQEWRVGVDEVFWGVTESRHLVDIINQKDYLERIDGDAKLGQPMLNWNWHGSRNNFEAFALPYFREQQFPDAGGRFRTPLPVTGAAFENGASRSEMSAALRWQYLGEGSDIALSYFDGVSREPQYALALRGGQLMIRPTYVQLSQWGLEAQKSIGNLLLKAEAIYRDEDQSSWAGVGGFEYTLDDIFHGDLGLLMEYLRDTRKWVPADTFEDDIFVGMRYASNTLSSTSILAGFYQDRMHGGRVFKLEAETRLGEKLKLSLELWRFDELRERELASFFRKDDYLEISLQYYWAK